MIPFVLGTAQFGQEYGIRNQDGAVSGDGARSIVNTAYEGGITIFDTAKLYGDSEAVLGQALQPFPQAKIITKYYADPVDPDKICADFEESCAHLHCDDIYAVLIHNADVLFSEAGAAVWAALERLKAKHDIQKIGVSVYGAEDFIMLAERFPLEIVQAPCNLLDQRMLSGRAQEIKQERGIEFHARSLFLQGLLLDSETPFLRFCRHIRLCFKRFMMSLKIVELIYSAYVWHWQRARRRRARLIAGLLVLITRRSYPRFWRRRRGARAMI